MTEMHERDLVATDEMIRNLRAGTFRKIATGAGICGALLLCGASLLVWTWKHGNDPEALKEALRQMPPLSVTVKLDPDSKIRLADGGTVRLANPPVFPQAATSGGGSHDPAIQTSVTVFKRVKYVGDDVIETGWTFANGAAKAPDTQYCHMRKFATPDGTSTVQNVGRDGKILAAPTGVNDQSERFTKCKWFNGDLG